MFEEERQRGSFDRKKLSYIIHGGQERTEKFIAKQKLIQSDPILRFDPATIQRSRDQLMNIYARKMIRYYQIFPPSSDARIDRSFFFTEQVPLSMHDGMFLTTLRNLCDEEQIKTILQPAERREILGCYAQTQLGHGSDVQQLMTTATYNQKNQTFVINTPETKAAKWWIGDLGVFADHAVVLAQLIIKGKRYGIHTFLVPIRDKNHKLYPGIQAGDIGPKIGFNAKDNGYAIFNNYEIPRRNMLMKYQRVSKQGVYSRVGNDKITYASMLKTRAIIPGNIFQSLSKCVVIIIRFSLARRQFKDNKGAEIPILNYQIQQQKIFPRISQTFATLFAKDRVYQLAELVIAEAKLQNKFGHLNEVHNITSGVKAIATRDGIRGMQILRRAAGGHGYHSYSGITGLLGEGYASVTYQGQNTVLFFQVARYLLKSLQTLAKGQPLDQSVKYLQNLNNPSQFKLDLSDPDQLTNPQTIVALFTHYSCQRLKKAESRLKQGISKGLDLKTAIDQYAGLQLTEAAVAHTYLWILNNFLTKIQLLADDQNVKKVLLRLFLLYGIQKISENEISIYESGVVTACTLKALRELRERLFQEIRPDALSIAEAFQYRDHTLASAIGTSDGRIYQNLLDWARNHNDVNKLDVKADIRKHVVKFYQQMRINMKDVSKL